MSKWHAIAFSAIGRRCRFDILPCEKIYRSKWKLRWVTPLAHSWAIPKCFLHYKFCDLSLLRNISGGIFLHAKWHKVITLFLLRLFSQCSHDDDISKLTSTYSQDKELFNKIYQYTRLNAIRNWSSVLLYVIVFVDMKNDREKKFQFKFM